MNTIPEAAIDDLYYELAMLEPSTRVDFLDQLVRTHPQHARELTDFAVELAFDDRSHGAAAPEMVADDDPIVMRAMSKFQNILYEMDNEAPVPTTSTSSTEGSRHQASSERPVNPFAQLTHLEMRRVAKELNANTLLVIKLRDRHLLPDTISPGFRKRTAEALGVPEPLLAAHLVAPPEMQREGLYKSERKPEATQQQSFEETIESLELSEDQRRYLLSL